jgi:hypothetical protein
MEIMKTESLHATIKATCAKWIPPYVEKVKDQMGYKAIGRKVVEGIDSFVLKETQGPYETISDKAIREHSEDNTFYW